MRPCEPGCPVCQARFRETAECSRCGADLTPLMALLARAFRLRAQARLRLIEGDAAAALGLAEAAEAMAPTARGRRLLALARWLALR